MPSYQVTAIKSASGKTEMLASHEFDARDTPAAKVAADTWSRRSAVTSSGSTSIRLFAGKVLISERALSGGVWEERRP